MASLLEWLGLKSAAPSEDGTASTATVRKIVAALEELEPSQARYLAAFAYLLGRVAHADLDISVEETHRMEEIVRGIGGLPEDQAVLAIGIAKSQNRLFGGTESFQVARELREIATREQRRETLDCLFAVAAADDEISGIEESEIRKIADELGFSHREYVAARGAWHEKRTVIKRLRK